MGAIRSSSASGADSGASSVVSVRPAQPSDIREVAGLWCEAFPGRRTVEDRIHMLESGGRYGGLETVMVARDVGGTLAGACKIYRLECHIAGVPMPMMGLAAVAVAPSHRRRGIGAHLCTRAVTAAADRGDLLSVLYPFRPDYYERLGWGLVGALHDYRFHTASLPIHPEEARHVRKAGGDDDADAIAACYARVAARSNGPITRDARVWAYRLAAQELGTRPLGEGDAEGDGQRQGKRQGQGEGAAPWKPTVDPKLTAVVFDDDGVSGYALLRRVVNPDGETRTLEVRELVAESERAYRGLLGHVAAQRARWPRARHFARPEELFGDRLRDPRPPGHRNARSLYFPTARIVRGPMLRLVDVPGALRRRRWFDADGARSEVVGGPAGEAGTRSAGGAGTRSAGGAGTQSAGGAATRSAGGAGSGAVRGEMVITVRDSQRQENEGPWTVRLNGGTAAVDAGMQGRAEAGEGSGINPGAEAWTRRGTEAGAEAGAEDGTKAGADRRHDADRPTAELSTDASTFARIFAGDISASDAARAGQAQIQGDSSFLDRAFATRERFWLLDEF